MHYSQSVETKQEQSDIHSLFRSWYKEILWDYVNDDYNDAG